MSEVDKILLQVESSISIVPPNSLFETLKGLDNKMTSFKSFLKRSEIYTVLNCTAQAEQDLTASLNLAGKDLISKQKYLPSILSKRSVLREKLGKFEAALEDTSSLYELTKMPEFLQRQNKLKMSMDEAKLKEEASEFLEMFKKNQETTPGSLWAVVSVKWVSRWASYVKLGQHFIQPELPFYFESKTFTGEYPGPIDNSDIIDSEQSAILFQTSPTKDFCLKTSAAENLHYILIPLPAFQYLTQIYSCDQTILRQAIEINDSMYQVEVFPKLLNLGVFHKNSLSTDVLITSCKSSVAVLKSTYLSKLSISGTSRVWKLNLQLVSIDKLLVLLKTNEQICVEGAKLLSEQSLIDDCEIGEHDLVFVELMRLGKFFFSDNNKKVLHRCGFCMASSRLKEVCKKCKAVKYCNVECLTKHLKDHTKKCRPKSQGLLRCFCKKGIGEHSDDDGKVVPIDSQFKFKEGLTGLQNLGNTCFMNSAIQCLSHTNELTDFFLSGRYKTFVNLNNPLGTGGKLVQAYAEVMQNLWNKENESYAPWKLKKVVGTYAPQFVGFQQQDAQELLGFLLDRIHEDLNQVKKKPYFEETELGGRSDQEMAEESWRRHTMRNQSFVVDLMHGQYKSSLLCPKCDRFSYAFDPFNSITLPLPQSTEKILSLYFIFYEGDKTPLKLSIEYKESQTFSHARSQLSQLLNLSPDTFIFTAVINDAIKTFLEETTTIDSTSNFIIFAYETKPSHPQIELQVAVKKGKSTTRSYPRVMTLPIPSSFIDLNHEIYKKFQHCFFRHSTNSSIETRFENFLEKPAYLTNFIPNREFCPFCREKSCAGCPVPYSSEPLSPMLNKGKLKVMIEWKSNFQSFGVKLNDINRCTEHSSVLGVTEKSKKIAVKLEECFELFRVPEKLGKDDTWYCPNCKTHVQATKKLEIYKVPPILILHVKRFKAEGNVKEKMHNPVIFPENALDVSEWVIGQKPKVYDLFGICNHYGNLSGGHYTATCFSSLNKRWFDFKDSLVSENSDWNHAASAYVLFYRQRK